MIEGARARLHPFGDDRKISGKVAYAVMSFGGFLGMGDSYHPLPWHVLTYDTGQAGHVVDLDRSRLEGAPTDGTNEAPN